MSKKSRKKSSKTPSGSPTAKKKPPKTRASTRTRSAKTQAASASKSNKPGAKATSHKAASKPLKSSEKASNPAAPVPSGSAKPIVTGMKAPAFRLPRDGGDVVTSADFSGQKLVLFFYPRADTPGCTREAIDFTRLKSDFTSAGTAVLGISADSLKAQEKFRDKHGLGVPLISDERHEMLEAYGAWGEKSMYGKTFLGILRTTVLIGADGKIAKVWRNVRVDGHAEEVLEAARSL